MSKFQDTMEAQKDKLEKAKEKLEEKREELGEKKDQLEEKLEEKLHAERTRKMMNIITIVGLVVAVAVCVIGWRAGLFTDQEVLDGFLAKAGAWAPIIFVMIQIIQVVIPIIPGGVSLVAGVLVFGPWMGFVYNYVGIVIGSILVFYLGRAYGKPWVRGMVSEKTYQKYIGWLDRGKVFDRLFAIAILISFMPDDFLCMVAGISSMSFKKFCLIILIAKIPSILLYSLAVMFGSDFLRNTLGLSIA